jgi:hypothetical protein
MNIFSNLDFERWLIVGFLLYSLYAMWCYSKRNMYHARTLSTKIKVLVTIPKTYLILYQLLIISDLWRGVPGFSDVIMAGTGNVYGLLMLLGVEAYVRWSNHYFSRVK